MILGEEWLKQRKLVILEQQLLRSFGAVSALIPKVINECQSAISKRVRTLTVDSL